MKVYEYVSLEAEVHMFGQTFTEHRNILEKYAKKGYSYVGYIPTKINTHGVVYQMDLIFEREADKADDLDIEK